MKVKSSIKKRGPGDQIVRRKGKLYVINKKKSSKQTKARLKNGKNFWN